MAQKLIPWNTGGGNIVVNYSGSGNDTVTVGSDTDNSAFTPRSQSITVRTTAGASISRVVTVTQSGKTVPVGTIYNFAYTGTVQAQELPPGTYKLQVWGAQGGQNPTYASYGITSQDGGKGGYSEGILTLTSPTTLYIFVGGQPSTSSTNGGWNGGGGGSGYSSYGNQTDTYGFCQNCCGRGGGATDIALVTSSMDYSSYRTNRSAASLLSRFMVAGGGGGGVMSMNRVTTTQETLVGTAPLKYGYTSSGSSIYVIMSGTSEESATNYGVEWGKTYRVVVSGGSFSKYEMVQRTSSNGFVALYSVNSSGIVTIGTQSASTNWLRFAAYASSNSITGATVQFYLREEVTTDTLISQTGYVGGGTNGGGYSSTYQGKQNSAGTQGGFGYGSNQRATTSRFVSACGGGGWYGGGAEGGMENSNYIKMYGGGSGFVNISANSSYRPSGYTGLELDSGATYAGDTSFPSTSGSTETGHSGDGYARITCIDPNALIPLTFDILGSGTIGWKTSGSSLTKTIQYKKNNGSWTNITSSTSGATISVSSGDVVQFRGSNTAYSTSGNRNNFTATCNFNVRGNIMSMFSNSGFESATTIPASYALKGLFYGNTYLKDASALLMPATTLTTYCYQNMFYGCTNMTGVPALPATITQERCYYRMFYNCSNITTAPVLNAATVATYGYYQMFYGCSKLNYIKCLATSISASNAVNGWVNGVAATGTFVKKSSMSSWSTGTSGIPSGWTVQNAS